MCDILKKKTRRNFSEKWLKDNRFKSWIRKVEQDDSLFNCIICDKKLSCNLSHVVRHANSACHKNNMKESTSLLNSNNVSSMKKISRKRKFQQRWLDIEQFKPWLCEVPHNENLFFCSICEKSIVGGKSQISRHGKSKAHIKMSEQDNMETSETDEMDETNELNEDVSNSQSENLSLWSKITFEERRKSTENRFAALIADKNIPYQTTEDILSFFQTIGSDYHVLRNMNMGRTKCQSVVRNVLYPVEIHRLINNIQQTKFSIFLDEIFDIANEKWTTFFVRYVDPETLNVHSQLVNLIKIDENEGDEKLFNAFQCEMSKHNIPFSNIVALSCNDASDTKPTYIFFQKKLKETCKKLLIFSCPHHSTALAVITAYKDIPNYCKEFLQKFANYICNCSKNCPLYEDFSECIQETNSKILKLSDTRWLCSYSYIEKLLDFWEIIKTFLGKIDKKEQKEKLVTSSGQYLLDIMEKPEVKAYLLFVKYILSVINSFINVFFQTLETNIHLLQLKSIECLYAVCKNFLKQKSLQNLYSDMIDFSIKEHQKSLYKVKLGQDCEEYLDKLMKGEHANIVENVRQNCLQFYVTAAKEISKKMPISDKFLSKLLIFQGETVLHDRNRESSFNDVFFIAQSFGGFDQNGLKTEWETLHEDFTTLEKQNLTKLKWDDMWKQILQHQDSMNNSKYPNLKSLLNAVRSLPNSNTDPERIYSFISDLKTTKRKKLSPVCINSISVLQSALEAKKETASKMQINAKHLALMSSDKLYTNSSMKQKKSIASDNDIDDPLSSNDI